MTTFGNFLPLRHISLIKGLPVISQQPMTVSSTVLLDITIAGGI
jgi:hypothetical protein